MKVSTHSNEKGKPELLAQATNKICHLSVLKPRRASLYQKLINFVVF